MLFLNNILLSLPFEIDFGIIFAFLTGIVFGVIIALLIYIYSSIRFLNKKTQIKKASVEVNEDEMLALIEHAKVRFNDKNLLGDNNIFSHFSNVISDLSLNIATKFYPNSKSPLLELTVDEALLLFVYVSQRLDEILDRKIFRIFRKVTFSKVISIINVKKAVDESIILSKVKDLKVGDVSKTTFSVINLFNPFYWGKKITINLVYDKLAKKICLATISIVGEELYAIYSKKLFNVESRIDSNIDELLESDDEVEIKKINHNKNKTENEDLFEENLKNHSKRRVFSDGFFDKFLKKKNNK